MGKVVLFRISKIAQVLIIVFIFTILFSARSIAKSVDIQGPVNVSATVGEYYLDLSGWQSPFASIILTSDGVFLRSTVADSTGTFNLSSILIKQGFSNFCLKAVDYKQVGTSETCFTVMPATASITKQDIFLPPTMALSATEIAEGKDVYFLGYTMPSAKVFLFISNGKVLTGQAEKSGYYSFKLAKVKAGKYTLYAKAQYQGKDSLTPNKKLSLWVLSWVEQLLNVIKDVFIRRLWMLLTSIILNPLWIAVPIFILIIILLLKIWPEKFTFIYQNSLVLFLTKLFRRHPNKHLHHYWLLGE